MDKDYIIIAITYFVVMLIVSIVSKVFFDSWFGFMLLGATISTIILVLIVMAFVRFVYNTITKSEESDKNSKKER